MNEEQKKEVLIRAIKTYGIPSQVRMAIEEMSELIKALCKLERAETVAERDMAVGNVIEEIGDVQIMLDQLRIIVKNDAKAVEDVKLIRLAGRIDKKEAFERAKWFPIVAETMAREKKKEERANE